VAGKTRARGVRESGELCHAALRPPRFRCASAHQVDRDALLPQPLGARLDVGLELRRKAGRKPIAVLFATRCCAACDEARIACDAAKGLGCLS